MTEAGITDSSITNCINTEEFKSWVGTASQVTTSTASLINAAAGGFSTPTVVVNGKRWDGKGDFLKFAGATAGSVTPSPSPSK